MTVSKILPMGQALYSTSAGDPKFEDEQLRKRRAKKDKYGYPVDARVEPVIGIEGSHKRPTSTPMETIIHRTPEDKPVATPMETTIHRASEKERAMPATTKAAAPSARSADGYGQLPSAPDTEESGLGDVDWGAIMIGATPALVGLLTGETEAGYRLSSKGLLDEAGRREKRALTERKLASKQKEKGRGTMYKYYNPETGRYEYGTAEKVEGEKAAEPRRPYEDVSSLIEQRGDVQVRVGKTFGRGLQLGKDEQGRNIITNKATGQVKHIGFDTNKYGPKEMSRIDKMVTGFESRAKQNISDLEGIKKFTDLINAKQPVSDQLAIFTLAKMADNGGRLSDQDVARFQGSKAYRARLDQAVKDAKDGTLTDKNRDFMREVANIIHRKGVEAMNGKINKTIRSRGKYIGIPENEIRDILGVYTESMPKKHKKENIKIIEGKTYIQLESGKWKEVK